MQFNNNVLLFVALQSDRCTSVKEYIYLFASIFTKFLSYPVCRKIQILKKSFIFSGFLVFVCLLAGKQSATVLINMIDSVQGG